VVALLEAAPQASQDVPLFATAEAGARARMGVEVAAHATYGSDILVLLATKRVQ